MNRRLVFVRPDAVGFSVGKKPRDATRSVTGAIRNADAGV